MNLIELLESIVKIEIKPLENIGSNNNIVTVREYLNEKEVLK